MKLKFIITWLCILTLKAVTAQIVNNPSTFNNGIKLPNATVDNSINDDTRIPLITTNGTIQSYTTLKDITSDIDKEHNELSGIQGGDVDEYFHLSESQFNWLKSQMYENYTYTFSVSPVQGERGVSVPLTLSYGVTSNDDVIVGANINQGIGNVLPDVDTGVKTISGLNSVNNITYTMTLYYLRSGSSANANHSTTYSSRVPQWAGWSTSTDFTTYSSINTSPSLQKYIQANSSITKQTSPTDAYIWFIVASAGTNIYDGNNFLQSIGSWGDNSVEFWKKPLTLTLADGTTTSTVYLIRSRTIKTLSNFTYKSN